MTEYFLEGPFERLPQPGQRCDCCGKPAVREIKTQRGWVGTCVVAAAAAQDLARDMAQALETEAETSVVVWRRAVLGDEAHLAVEGQTVRTNAGFLGHGGLDHVRWWWAVHPVVVHADRDNRQLRPGRRCQLCLVWMHNHSAEAVSHADASR